MADKYEMGIDDPAGRTAKAGIAIWKVAGVCSLIVGLGLAIGLSVGLTKDPEIVYIEQTTVKPAPTTSTASTTTKQSTTQKTTTTTVQTTTSEQATTAAVTTTTAPPEHGIWDNYRLPSHIVPVNYKLTLHPNMTTNDYTGTNAMTITITEEKDKCILVHAHETLNITGVKLEKDGMQEVPITSQFRHAVNEFYVVCSDDDLGIGSYLLTMDFYNRLDKAIVGIYISTYFDPLDGVEKGIVGSDMEPTDARRGYPCFDEPALKVTYSTSIIHETRHNALSNMPAEPGSPFMRDDGLMQTNFETSVPMSTYLGCFIVSEFEYIETNSSRGIPLRVYVPKYMKELGQANYSLEVMKIIFDFFEIRFGMNYTLPKCDMISIPNFGTGAMENWGLITYRETNLIYDPKESSTTNKQRVAAVISHELVHQWFGNIVTMKWWDNIWLNEGFASYLEYEGLKVAEPTWQIMDQFLINDLQPVMRTDSSITSHPIVVNVSTPSQITEVFDSISYSKGGSVLRMLHSVIGDDLFYGGLNNYLKNRMFSNANEQDLWEDMQKFIDNQTGVDTCVGINIKEFMDPYVLQMGLPVLSVSDPSASEETVTVSQQHMISDPNVDLTERPESDFNYMWKVHIKHYTSNDKTPNETCFPFGDINLEINVGSLSLSNGDWLKLNLNEMGYYRVNYGTETWKNIASQLEDNFTIFTEADRSNILDDGFNLAPAKLISYTQALNLTTYLDEERSYIVWDSYASGSSYIRQMLESSDTPDVYNNFKMYYKSKVKPTADELGWNATEGSHVDKLNRYNALALALRYGDQEALDNATELFNEWYNDPDYYLHPDIRSLVYRYGIADPSTGVNEWEYMLERYITETIASEKLNLLRGLASTEDVALIDRLLDYSKNESIIKSQDFFTCITYISYTPTGNEMAWTWSQLNWEYMVDRFSINDRNLGRLVPNIVGSYNTEQKLWEVESFFERYPEAGAGARGRENALQEIKENIVWITENEAEIADWLVMQLNAM